MSLIFPDGSRTIAGWPQRPISDPGRAQPMQMPSYGTPYGQGGGGGFGQYSPQGGGEWHGNGVGFQPYAPRREGGSGRSQEGMGWMGGERGFAARGGRESGFGGFPDGNMAYASPERRPPPFQAAYGQIGGGFSSQPNFGQRDAFINNINNQLGQMQRQSWANPGSVGAPQFNFGQMWNQAGDMVQRGWQSPLAGLFGF